MGIGSSGSVFKTASGNLSKAGKPIRVFNVTIVSGTTAGAFLYNGSAASGTHVMRVAGVAAGVSNTVNLGEGLLFSSGCYVAMETGASLASIECSLEL